MDPSFINIVITVWLFKKGINESIFHTICQNKDQTDQ